MELDFRNELENLEHGADVVARLAASRSAQNGGARASSSGRSASSAAAATARPAIAVPRAFVELSSSSVLTQEMLDGATVASVVSRAARTARAKPAGGARAQSLRTHRHA